ncbi:hypothetical protein DPMN_077220 [Dreissena polymorpha]|uniref:Uncharacterized protein n=1 Tax=Dreissena polymorpha TaxID=45954 RepID=A0A9D4BR57_DREPO|nr:hypothetical protein DPMN_077220 [Dreissena polymorpha]
MLGVSTFWFAAMGLKHKVMYTGCLLVFTIGVLEANFISNPPSTWYDGYIKCRHNNQTMLNWVMWKDGTTDLKIQYPVWLYGFETNSSNSINYKTPGPPMFVARRAHSRTIPFSTLSKLT